MTSKFLLNHQTDSSPAEIKGSFPVDFSDYKDLDLLWIYLPI